MIHKNSLYGLVLTGGRSTRMKKDKAILNYHGKHQSDFCFEFLSQFCDKVFLSNRKDQAEADGQKDFPQIHDCEEFSNIGPLGGILSAMYTYPESAWLVLACDLPFITHETITTLIEQRDPQKLATAYRSAHDSLPEPLCAVYEPKSQGSLLEFFKNGTNCPRKILMDSDVKLIDQSDRISLDNVNHPDEYQKAIKNITKKS